MAKRGPDISQQGEKRKLGNDEDSGEGSTQKEIEGTVKKKARVQRKCCTLNCESDNSTETLHTVPGIYIKENDRNSGISREKLERCREWVKNVGNKALLSIPAGELQNRFYVCNKHFDETQKSSKSLKHIKRSAVPTLFSCPGLSETEMNHFDTMNGFNVDMSEDVNDCNRRIVTLNLYKGGKTPAEESPEMSRVVTSPRHQEENTFARKSDQILSEEGSKEKNSNKTNVTTTGRPVDEQEMLMHTQTSYTEENMNNNNSTLAGRLVDEQVVDEQAMLMRPQTSNTKGNERKSRMKCCFMNCQNNGSGETQMVSMYRFPQVKKEEMGELKINHAALLRTYRWLQATGNRKLLNLSPLSLNKMRVCENHFDVNQKGTRSLNKNADPKSSLQIPEEDMTLYKKHFSFLPGEPYVECVQSWEDIEKCLDFEFEMANLSWFVCPQCKEKQLKLAGKDNACSHRDRCLYYTEYNNMDPGPVPPELKDLSFIEEQLIARVHPMISVFKLNPGQQFGYSGNIISFAQDIQPLATELPLKLENLHTVINVKFENNSGKSHHFRVRADKVYSALVWLIRNNPYYSDVKISEENLRSLPKDGNVENLVCFTVSSEELEKNGDSENDVQPTVDDETSSSDGDSDDIASYVHETFVPSSTLCHPDDQIGATLNWPKLDEVPVNEFKTVGYIACAFPTLFPKGAGDLREGRVKAVTPNEYFKHLLAYHDGRFSQHATFRFFGMNSTMRWNALTDGNIFVRNNPEFKDMTASQLKELLRDKPQVLKKMMYITSNLRGSKQYWGRRCNDLGNFIEQVGLPTVFLTLSFADYHYPDLFRLLTDKDAESLSERERHELVQKNPAVVDTFFSVRVETFLEKVVVPKYQVVDSWYRIEYQHRGSPHAHGLLWFKDAPDVTNLKDRSEDDQSAIKKYFENLISAMNPDMFSHKPDIHPCRKSFWSSAEDKTKDLAQLLNTVQRHTKCSRNYCLKFNKKEQKYICRFKFPFETQDESTFTVSEKGTYEFTPARNDPYLNKFNPYISQAWRANIDISPVISKEALIGYLTKYIAKSEKASTGMMELLVNLLSSSDDNEPVIRPIQKLFTRSCGERDFSAQEVCHILLGLKLYASSRQFVYLNLSKGNDWVRLPSNCEVGPTQFTSLLEKYKKRPPQLEQTSLWQIATSYNPVSWKLFAKKRIVVLFPKYLKKENDLSEAYCRQETLLHHPWRDEKAFLEIYPTWKEAYDQLNIQSGYVAPLVPEDKAANENDGEEDEADDEEDRVRSEEWMVLSKLGPTNLVERVELGCRDIDRDHDWHSSDDKYHIYGTVEEFKTFIAEKKKDDSSTTISEDDPRISFDDEQSIVISLLDEQIKCLKLGIPSSLAVIPKRVIVQGKAGTGKSLLIKHIADKVRKEFGSGSVMITAPTGISALSINGQTVHSAFHLPKSTNKYKSLEGEAGRKFRENMKEVKVLIVDEYSMVGCTTIEMIQRRCQQGTGNYDSDFGDLIVYFFGDVAQLPPVCDTAIYSEVKVKETQVEIPLAVYGKKTITNFEGCVLLNNSHRQESAHFKSILDRLGQGTSDLSDYRFFQSRFQTNVSLEEKDLFRDAIRLFSKVNDVDQHNAEIMSKLVDTKTHLPVPVAKIPGKHNCKEAAKALPDFADGLEANLYLSKGCKVMLRNNLWTAKGLVNGAIGTVVDILYEGDHQPPDEQPSVVLCDFPSYTGPPFIPNSHIVPIPSLKRTWNTQDGMTHSRIQFPLKACYAVTIHKSQGLTLDKAVIDLGDTEFSLGLSYVAMSRVKTPEGLLLVPFSFDRINRLGQGKMMENRQKFEKQLQILAERTKHQIQ